MKVTVFVGNKGEVAEMMAATGMVRYELRGDQWEKSESVSLNLHAGEGLAALRSRIPAILNFCQDSDAVAAETITGVMSYELARAGYSLWEVSGQAEEFLDKIRAYGDCTCFTDDPEVKEAFWPDVVTLEPGNLQISLVDLQHSNHAISTKQVLIPLLTEPRFATLRVICAHIPPWLQVWISEGRIKGEIDSPEGLNRVIMIYGNMHQAGG